MKLLTEREAHTFLNVSRPTLRRLAEAGKIPAPIRFGRTLRYDQDGLENAVRKMQAEART